MRLRSVVCRGWTVHRCNVSFALLELPNPTWAAMAFKDNVAQPRRNGNCPAFRPSRTNSSLRIPAALLSAGAAKMTFGT
jgi:homoserine kinase